MDFQEIENIFNINRICPEQIFCIVDKNNTILYPENIDHILKRKILNGDKSTNTIRYDIDNSNLAFISYLPETYITKKVLKIKVLITIITILFCIIVTVIVYYMSGRVTKPLLNLVKKMDTFCSADSGSTSNDYKTNHIYEVDKINSSFSFSMIY